MRPSMTNAARVVPAPDQVGGRLRREPICGRPPACKSFAAADRIACDHMSGLLMRSHMTAAKMGFATRGPNITAMSGHRRWVPRSVSRLEIDRSHHLLRLEQASASARGEDRRVLNGVFRLQDQRRVMAGILLFGLRGASASF